jgi:hypothetical protein
MVQNCLQLLDVVFLKLRIIIRREFLTTREIWRESETLLLILHPFRID